MWSSLSSLFCMAPPFSDTSQSSQASSAPNAPRTRSFGTCKKLCLRRDDSDFQQIQRDQQIGQRIHPPHRFRPPPQPSTICHHQPFRSHYPKNSTDGKAGARMSRAVSSELQNVQNPGPCSGLAILGATAHGMCLLLCPGLAIRGATAHGMCLLLCPESTRQSRRSWPDRGIGLS